MRNLTEIQRDMHDYLPRYYEEISVATNMVDREAVEMARLNSDVYDILAQMFVDTATWGLARWERQFGVVTDEAKPIDQRRSVIKSRLRGAGTVTPALVESVAEAYANGDVNVTEDNPNATITITFISTRGVPVNLDDILSVLRDIIPAHLVIKFEFTYLSFGELDASGVTFGNIESEGLTFGELETWKP